MSSNRSLTCEELIDFLSGYIEGELDADVRERFDAHLAICPACVDYLESYRATVRVASATREAEAELPGDAPEELIRAVLASRCR